MGAFRESLLRFIINSGGKVRNVDLLTHYRRFLREDEESEQNRELFKRYVNSVATVRQEEGVSHVVLRKKYRVGQSFEQPWESKATREATDLEHNGVYVAKQRQLREADGCEQSFVNPAYYEVRVSPTVERKRQSSRDLSSPSGSTRSLATSLHDGSFSGKHSSIPLDPREHDWFVKAASGTWTDIYALFRDDPNLLSKQDFISGFTIVHWIAKHGDHRVLNTLWYGVDKAGMTLDVNAKTLCGYTPLHLAVIHGHKKLIRLLVQKFNADVRIRDSSGKRAWQYLSKNENWDILELLGAPQKCISGSPATPANLTARPSCCFRPRII
uniref:SOWAHA-C winged helix-turn-helix domain-containing protein n=1 Tax=Sinocyclocheilus rhinocerous TaxID=307959 RepID=A0A673FEU6_9TELE